MDTMPSPRHRTRIKICCIADQEEAALAIAAGADALGLVGPMPSGPGVIPDATSQAIAHKTAPPISTFLLTSETTVQGIIAHYRKVHSSTLQLVDALSEGSYAELRAALPAVKLVQVIHVLDQQSVQEALQVAPEVDALLLDSGNPNLSTKVLGGTGQTHDWGLSRQIREKAPCPVFLAGGLRAENVEAAIAAVQPFGVDVCSGVRTEGKLDPEKLRRFVEAVEKSG